MNLRQRRRVEEPREQRDSHAEESQEQRENRFAAQSDNCRKESVPRNHKNNVKTVLRLKEIMPKESMPRNHKSNVKIIALHSGTAQSMIIAWVNVYI